MATSIIGFLLLWYGMRVLIGISFPFTIEYSLVDDGKMLSFYSILCVCVCVIRLSHSMNVNGDGGGSRVAVVFILLSSFA